MNLSEAMDAALPEIPKARLSRIQPPRLDPNLIVREDILDGEPIVGVLQRGSANYFRFPPAQWQLAQLFDGEHSYDEIASLYNEQTGTLLTGAEVRLFAQNMDESDFWYKSPQEKNIALNEKLMAQRNRRANRKSKINIAHIGFSAWDPDRYLGWLDRHIGPYLYSNGCLFAIALLFIFEAVVFVVKWSTIGPDVLLYYTFTNKGLLDLIEFWVLFLILGFFHETAHGLTCKHYGGEVHSMGLMFLYLTPAFYADVTESWVSGTKVQRLATIIAGIWVEMTICGLSMIVWTNTQPGEWLHDFSYKIILLTGLAVVIINLNPLIKLDGYYFLTECIGIPDLKERSTAFLSGWVQRRVLRLPVEVPVVPRRRVPLFAIYAFASGAYSYLLLFTVIRFTYNAASNWLAEFALIPAGALAFGIFRSRLRSLKTVGTQSWTQAFGTGFRIRIWHVLAILTLLVLLFVPFWRDREAAFFVVEPLHSQTIHAAVAGRVVAVLVHEGQRVRAGEPLLRFTSNAAAALQSSAKAQTQAAQYKAFDAEVRSQSVQAAAAEQMAATHATAIAEDAQASLVLDAPADGVVLSVDPSALLQRDVADGTPLLQLANAGAHAVRVFVPVYALDRIPPGASVAFSLPDRFSVLHMKLAPLENRAVQLPAGILPKQDYKGIQLPTFYSARMVLPAAANLPLGESGNAIIFGRRRSVVERSGSILMDLVRAHVW